MKINWRMITGIIIVLTIIILIGYDILIDAEGGVATTISRVTIETSIENHVIPAAAGVLCGHLFILKRNNKWYWLGIIFLIGVGIFKMITAHNGVVNPIFPFLLGLGLGGLVWYQRDVPVIDDYGKD